MFCNRPIYFLDVGPDNEQDYISAAVCYQERSPDEKYFFTCSVSGEYSGHEDKQRKEYYQRCFRNIWVLEKNEDDEDGDQLGYVFQYSNTLDRDCHEREPKVFHISPAGGFLSDNHEPPEGLYITDKQFWYHLIMEYLPTPLRPDENNIMLKLLEEYLPREAVVTPDGPYAGEVNGGNGGWIPYDMEKRKRLYPKAFRELARYMK